jgi:nucleoside-diphosphate-sugar epimerase
LNACKDVDFDCFVNTGSSSEYGIKDIQMRESNIVLPISDYGVAKAAATQFCIKEALFNKLPIYTVRPFSVYGDYEMQGRLIPTILLGALQKTQINLSCASFVRDFIYVQDLVDIYLKIAQIKPDQHIFNAGTGVQSTIGDVVGAVELITNSKLNVSWYASVSRPWEPKVWQANIDQALSLLDWQPKYSLKDGLRKSLKWFENNLHCYVKNYENTKSDRTKPASV